MRSLRHAAIAGSVLLAMAGCASGGGGHRDGGTGGGRDGGGTQSDGGGPIGCEPGGWADTCQMATDLGPVMSGGRVESGLHLVERRAGAQWALVRFPPEPPPEPPPVDGSAGPPDGGVVSMAGGGTPGIRFVRNDADAYRIEIRTACTSVASCGGGAASMATNITEWSFTDDPAMSAEGAGQLSSRDVPWPETVYLRVYAAQDPDCGRYQIEITR